jgi:hypothetical protein
MKTPFFWGAFWGYIMIYGIMDLKQSPGYTTQRVTPKKQGFDMRSNEYIGKLAWVPYMTWAT